MLKYDEVIKFMKDFKVDILNRYDEFIIDEPTNTYTYIGNCKDIEDVKYRVVYSICRPIGKGLSSVPANRILDNFNSYFNTELTRADMLLMYQELCYERTEMKFKQFIKDGFPMHELKGE